MAAKKIYIVRHGQTKYNKEGVVQGRGIDASLDDIGRAQAKKFYNYYKDVPFQRIMISKLKRTYESVGDFIDLGIPYQRYEGLDEISWGLHEGAKASESRNEYFKKVTHAWRNGDVHIKIEGGESPEDVALRQNKVIDEFRKMPEDLILVCMHGRAIRILLCNLLNIPLSEMDNYGHYNLGLYIVSYENNEFKILESNSDKHLNGV